MNKAHDYAALEREYVTGTMSLRELARRHGITAHSGVVVQARKSDWLGKREAYRARHDARLITRLADDAADREAEIRDHALDAIDAAITRFRADLRATERRRIDGEWVEVPLVRVTPKDLALLIDRLQVLVGRPSSISEDHDFRATVTSEPLPLDALQRIVEPTRGLAPSLPGTTSGLPRLQEKRPD